VACLMLPERARKAAAGSGSLKSAASAASAAAAGAGPVGSAAPEAVAAAAAALVELRSPGRRGAGLSGWTAVWLEAAAALVPAEVLVSAALLGGARATLRRAM